jgi:hypothetical protein
LLLLLIDPLLLLNIQPLVARQAPLLSFRIHPPLEGFLLGPVSRLSPLIKILEHLFGGDMPCVRMLHAKRQITTCGGP